MSLKIIDKTPQFLRLTNQQLDRAMFSMANDIQNLAKMKAPVKQGHLYSRIIARRKPGLKNAFVVEADMEYARYQEFGGDGKRKVKRYTKPGTGAHYLGNSGKIIAGNAIMYFKKEIRNASI